MSARNAHLTPFFILLDAGTASPREHKRLFHERYENYLACGVQEKQANSDPDGANFRIHSCIRRL
jgi:hypothetical protein